MTAVHAYESKHSEHQQSFLRIVHCPLGNDSQNLVLLHWRCGCCWTCLWIFSLVRVDLRVCIHFHNTERAVLEGSAIDLIVVLFHFQNSSRYGRSQCFLARSSFALVSDKLK